MAWCPFAVKKPVTRFKYPLGRASRINYHTAVSNAASLHPYFNQYGMPCSHFYIDKWGGLEQYISTSIRAAADLQGNPDTVSIETWDGYPKGSPGFWRNNGDVPPWNAAQMRTLVRLTKWLYGTVPGLRDNLARDSVPGLSSSGASYHRLGIDPYRKSGGLKYSNSWGKICPGPRRINQVPEVKRLALGGGPPTPAKSVRPEKEVQMILALIGHYDIGPGGKYWDGVNGPAQTASTVAYQKGKKGLAADGQWGPATENYFKENDMADLIKEIAKASGVQAARRTWGFVHSTRNRNQGYMARLTYDNSRRAVAGQAGLLKAIEQISAGKPVDLEAIKRAAEEGAAGAIDSEGLAVALAEALADELPAENAARVADAVVARLGALLTNEVA